MAEIQERAGLRGQPRPDSGVLGGGPPVGDALLGPAGARGPWCGPPFNIDRGELGQAQVPEGRAEVQPDVLGVAAPGAGPELGLARQPVVEVGRKTLVRVAPKLDPAKGLIDAMRTEDLTAPRTASSASGRVRGYWGQIRPRAAEGSARSSSL